MRAEHREASRSWGFSALTCPVGLSGICYSNPLAKVPSKVQSENLIAVKCLGSTQKGLFS